MIYGDNRWTDIEDIEKQTTVVVCPLAALEQHGFHLPLLTDTYITTAIAQAVEANMPDDVLLVPTMWMGASDHHMDFPGTISLPNSLYSKVIKAFCLSLVSAGFEKILLLNGHGGNVAPGTSAITELACDHDACDDAYIAFASYWEVAAEVLKPEKHGIQSAGLSHACEYETSMMLHLHGDLVALNRAEGNTTLEFDDLPGVNVASRFYRRTASGAMGNPEHATAEKGASLIAASIESITQLVTKMREWPAKPVLGPA